MKKTAADAVRVLKGFRYRKKPVVIEAALFDGQLVGLRGSDGRVEPLTCPTWFPAVNRVLDAPRWAAQVGKLDLGQVVRCDGSLFIGTLEGTMEARPGDWIIRGVKGEIYPCKPDIFAATYEPVDEA